MSQRQRQPLLIDPYYRAPTDASHVSSSPSSPAFSTIMSSVSRASSTGGADWRVCFVLCLYDFDSSDPDHLPFRKNEILEIVKQEESGWWAALRDDKIGWVPCAFLIPLTDEMAVTLRNMHEELRLFEYDAEKLYNTAPISNISQFFDSPSTPDSPRGKSDNWVPIVEPEEKVPFMQINSTGLISVKDFPDDVAPSFSYLSPQSPPQGESNDGYSPNSEASPLSGQSSWQSPPCPPSPSTPMPQPVRPKIVPLLIEKPTPPTPRFTTPESGSSRSPLSRSRSDSAPSMLSSRRTSRRRPIMLADHSSLSRLSVYIDSRNPADESELTTPDLYKSYDYPEVIRSPISKTRSGKVKQLTGDDDAQAFHNAKIIQASLPWYLRPTYSADDIKMDNDGSVRAGTLHALVERLTSDPSRLAQETLFRHTFLTTFSTFSTAEEVFDLLVARYEMDHPTGLSSDEFQEWKEKKLRPVQKRVLTILTIWVEEHGLLQDDPHIIPRLRDFLGLIVSPPPQALSAKLMLQSLDRMAAALQSPPPVPLAPIKRRKHKPKTDFLRMDPLDLAQQLTVYEHRLYAKLRPRECLHWAKTQKGEAVSNLTAFCATHDKLAAWVKTSVLSNDGLGKRADIIDHWIKIVEKCRGLSNFSSMSAIVAALSSAVITRLHLTWAHVGRGSQLEPLARLNEPTGNFTAYRTLHQTLEAPCIPFIGVFLSDLVHVQDQLKDTFAPPPAAPLVNFVKRQKWYDAVNAIVRYQNKPYSFGENPATMSFVEGQLLLHAGKDHASFWARSQELQQNEVAHADIRKGLEAAGF